MPREIQVQRAVFVLAAVAGAGLLFLCPGCRRTESSVPHGVTRQAKANYPIAAEMRILGPVVPGEKINLELTMESRVSEELEVLIEYRIPDGVDLVSETSKDRVTLPGRGFLVLYLTVRATAAQRYVVRAEISIPNRAGLPSTMAVDAVLQAGPEMKAYEEPRSITTRDGSHLRVTVPRAQETQK